MDFIYSTKFITFRLRPQRWKTNLVRGRESKLLSAQKVFLEFLYDLSDLREILHAAMDCKHDYNSFHISLQCEFKTPHIKTWSLSFPLNLDLAMWPGLPNGHLDIRDMTEVWKCSLMESCLRMPLALSRHIKKSEIEDVGKRWSAPFEFPWNQPSCWSPGT